MLHYHLFFPKGGAGSGIGYQPSKKKHQNLISPTLSSRNEPEPLLYSTLPYFLAQINETRYGICGFGGSEAVSIAMRM